MSRHVIADLPANMQSKIRVADDCWVWTGAKNRKGYGSVAGGVKNRSVLAHRKAYELTKGPIPKGLQIDHLCFNTSCVNPAHLEAVTAEENVRRRYARHAPVARAVDMTEAHRALDDFFAAIEGNQRRVAALPEDERVAWDERRLNLHRKLGTTPPELLGCVA